MQELIRRGVVQSALAGKDEKSLSILIKFIQRFLNFLFAPQNNSNSIQFIYFSRNISNPNFTATLTDIANMLLGKF